MVWEDEGLVELAPLSHGKLIPSGEAVLAEGRAVLPSWLWDGWIRFWRGEDPAVPLVGSVPPFFGRVYAVVRRIPVGGVRTYRQVAEEVGVPEGARAVFRFPRGKYKADSTVNLGTRRVCVLLEGAEIVSSACHKTSARK